MGFFFFFEGPFRRNDSEAHIGQATVFATYGNQSTPTYSNISQKLSLTTLRRFHLLSSHGDLRFKSLPPRPTTDHTAMGLMGLGLRGFRLDLGFFHKSRALY